MIGTAQTKEYPSMDLQIRERIYELELEGYLVFQGLQALNLIRRYCALTGSYKPKLWVYCETQVGQPPRLLENFVPKGVIIDGESGIIQIIGSLGKKGDEKIVRFDPAISWDKKAKYMTYVCTMPNESRAAEMDDIELASIT